MAERNPRDLQALLKFCMEHTKSEDAPSGGSAVEAMDPERREWLRKFLDSSTVDVVQQLAQCITVLNDEKVVSNEEAGDEDLEKVEEALGVVEDWVGQIDMAKNFHQLGGYEALKLCLDSPHSEIRSGACHVIAELAQNNDYCQEKFVEEEFLNILLSLLDDSSSNAVRIKALYGISCIVRECGVALDKFATLDGLSFVVRALQTSGECEKLRTKSCFFLRSLCQERPEMKASLTKVGIVEQLAALIQLEHDGSHEHMTHCLRLIAEGNEQAVKECRNETFNLVQVLEKKIADLEGNDANLEEVEHCKAILKLMGHDSNQTATIDR